MNTLEDAKVAKDCLYIQMPVQEVCSHRDYLPQLLANTEMIHSTVLYSLESLKTCRIRDTKPLSISSKLLRTKVNYLLACSQGHLQKRGRQRKEGALDVTLYNLIGQW